MRDKVDEHNRDRHLHSNLIKWWNVNLIMGEEDMEEVTDTVSIARKKEEENRDDLLTVQERISAGQSESQGMEDDEKELLHLIMNQNDHSTVYQEAMDEIQRSQLQQANEIYERLMREQAEDDAKKEKEIEYARQEAKNSGI